MTAAIERIFLRAELIDGSASLSNVAQEGFASWVLSFALGVSVLLLLVGAVLAGAVTVAQIRDRRALRDELATAARSARDCLTAADPSGAGTQGSGEDDGSPGPAAKRPGYAGRRKSDPSQAALQRVKTNEEQAREYLARLAVADRLQVVTVALLLASGLAQLTVLVFRLT